MKKLNVSLSIIALAFFALACGIDFGAQNPGTTPTLAVQAATTPTLAVQGAPALTQAAANVPTSAPTVGRSLTILPTSTSTLTATATPSRTLPTVTNTPTVTPTAEGIKTCPPLPIVSSGVPTGTLVVFNPNLIENGDAEGMASAPQLAATDDSKHVAPQGGWLPTGNVSVDQYDANGLVKSNSPGTPSDHGKNYFSGGPNNAQSSASQTIDLSVVCPDAIAASGDSIYTFVGALGGYTGQDDFAVVTAEFKAKDGTTLGKATLGPVLAKDRKAGTSFADQTANGTLPRDTRTIVFTMSFTRVGAGDYNDGMVDDLSFYFVY